MSNDIMSQRVLRLLMGMFLPCPIALFLYLLCGAIAQKDSSILELFVFFPIAYFISGLQSFIYSLIMEYYVWPTVGRNYIAVIVSTLLGAICGLSVLFIMQYLLPWKESLILLLLSGSCTGLIIGFILYFLRKGLKEGSRPETQAGKNKIQICLSVIIPIIIICLLVVIDLRRPGPLRLLGPKKTRKTVKSMTGRKLPLSAEELQGISQACEGRDGRFHECYVTFKTDQEGISHILNTFGGEDVLVKDFPNPENNTLEWKIMDFEKAYSLQKELGVVLFDFNLIRQIRNEDLEFAIKKSYPEDAITGWYIESRRSSIVSYLVLIFKDRGLVYIRIVEDSYKRQNN